MLKTYSWPRYATRRAPEIGQAGVRRVPLVVVGAGPVGLSAAIDAALHGLPVVLLDDDDTVSVGSRGVCYAKRTLEIFDRLGLGQRVVDKGITWNVGRTFHGDQEVFAFDLLPEAGHRRPGMVNLQQYHLEQYLVERALELPAIDLRWKHKVARVTPGEAFATVEVETADGPYRLECDWLIVADGARSPIRRALGLDIEGIDRLYLNLYQPRLQSGGGVVAFFKGHRGAQVASTTLMAPMTRDFAAAVQQCAKREGVAIVHFAKGQRKDDETQRRLKDFTATEGVLYIGVAQEKCSTFRVAKRFSERTGTSFPWLYRSTVLCNHYYFYVVDEDFGPLFIKFAGYFPYTARLCLNGHEYAKCQLRKEGIAFEALDNGIATCAEPRRLQQINDGLDAAREPPRIPAPVAGLREPHGVRHEGLEADLAAEAGAAEHVGLGGLVAADVQVQVVGQHGVRHARRHGRPRRATAALGRRQCDGCQGASAGTRGRPARRRPRRRRRHQGGCGARPLRQPPRVHREPALRPCEGALINRARARTLPLGPASNRP